MTQVNRDRSRGARAAIGGDRIGARREGVAGGVGAGTEGSRPEAGGNAPRPAVRTARTYGATWKETTPSWLKNGWLFTLSYENTTSRNS